MMCGSVTFLYDRPDKEDYAYDCDKSAAKYLAGNLGSLFIPSVKDRTY